jgi:hypothetical protein
MVPGVVVERRVVVKADYLVDEVSWAFDAPHAIGLPIHLEGAIAGVAWTAAPLEGAGGLEDGFDFVKKAEHTTPGSWPVHIEAVSGDERADVWLAAPAGTVLWRARAPGPPGHPERQFFFLEADRRHGTAAMVLSWRGNVRHVELRDETIVVERADGTKHELGALQGLRVVRVPPGQAPLLAEDQATYLRLERGRDGRSGDVVVALGEPDYRRSEQTWREAGAPTAELRLWADRTGLHVAVESRTGPPVILPDGADNDMDNEQADVNASGVQLHLLDGRGRYVGWLLRPSPANTTTADPVREHEAARLPARVRVLGREAPPISAHWAPTSSGWSIEATIPYAALGDASPYSVGLGLVVNEIPPDRERRRGQLVLGGAAGEWVFLRGDRHDPDRLVSILID